MRKHLECVAVVSIQPVLRAEPKESLIVLNNLLNARLGQPLGIGETGETQIVGVNDGNSNGLGIDNGLDRSLPGEIAAGARAG